jgi:ribosomal protein L11 methyltransferase
VPEARYPFVHVSVGAGDADVVSSVLFDLGATGVEERDASTMLKAPEGTVLLVASFDSFEEAEGALDLLKEHDAKLEPTLEVIEGDAWRDAYKEFFKPFLLTKTITIKPPWCEVEGQRSTHVLELEPGRAFGTGLHATTSLVARILEDAEARVRGLEMLDAGTGSGILALVALLLGAKKVTAFDVDADVIPLVMENAERNGLADRVEAFAGTIDDVKATFPWVVANIEAKVLVPLADEIVARVAPGGELVLSGILASEETRLVAHYTSLRRKLELVEARRQPPEHPGTSEEGWVALHLVAKA